MKYIIRGRDTGKARELLQYARDNEAMVITQNKRAFQVKADSLGFGDVEIIDYDDLASENYSMETDKIVIHNLDKWVWDVFFNSYELNTIGFTMTEE